MKLYDTFTFNGEKECLKIRCEELKHLDPIHVIVEGRHTFTRNPKPLKFPEIEHEFKEYNIRYIIVDEVSVEDSAWATEELHRNAIMRGLYDAEDKDVIIISDADEIPRTSCVEEYKASMGLTALRMDVFWYKLNCLAEKKSWTHPKICTWEYLKDKTPNDVRASGFPKCFDNGGWHFSYAGDENYIVDKIQSFSHIEFNQEKFIDKDEIKRKINSGISLWGESQFEFVDIDETFPKYIQENKEQLKHLICEL